MKGEIRVADLHIVRKHALGLKVARRIAFNWAEQVENDLGMRCTYEEGRSADRVSFSRSGVQGHLEVTRDRFELDAKLGFLIGAFKGRIEAEITEMLSRLVPEPQAAAGKSAAAKSVTEKSVTGKAQAAKAPTARQSAARKAAAKQ